MAEGRYVRQNDVICRYFMISSCRDGDRCLFSHDSTRGTPDSVCRYYLRGTCDYGRNCRYDHVRVNKQGNSKSRPHNLRHSAGHSRHSDSTNRDATNNYTRYQSRGFSSQDSRTADSVCHNYLQGRCVYGRNCRYDHVRVNEEGNSSSYPHNDGHSAGPSRHSSNLDASSNCTRCESNKRNGHQPKFNEPSQNTRNNRFRRTCEKNEVHIKQSENHLEKDAALAFAIQSSLEKTCGICMDVVLEKEPFSERKFGILEKCNHVFCFSCISKWRNCNQRELSSVTTKACPECRIISDFVTPSEYFIDTEKEKKKLIAEYKKALSQKNCKYFKKGKGRCVSGETCLYLHANPDGSKVEHPIPTSSRQQDEDDPLHSIYDQLEFLNPFHDGLFYAWNEYDSTDDELDDDMHGESDNMDELDLEYVDPNVCEIM